MGDIEVVTAELRTAAGKVGEAAESVGAVTPGTAVGRISTALPGSDSASAARTCSTSWTRRLEDWVTAAEAQKSRLASSAENYDGADAAAYNRMTRLLRLQ
ncbi:hypothetical protein GEV29_08645 [Aeromicrobium sp. SMF47]|uniref:type VII secretion target n=1 Tax=Aeromicrobium yanjiei TaxID=2662028 RepID=UPI00129E42B0|nr:type VII secretion target [Aeromicrobium yanjiei]MRJ76601.1 hypothetical protein [Aeromicrobium yanjiei]